MSKVFKPHNYQNGGVEIIVNYPFAALFWEMGMGKTVTGLTAVDILMYDAYQIKKVLIIAPLKVAQSVWAPEAETWAHLKHLRISKVLGTDKQRKEALKVNADIYVINRDNIVWLIAYLGGAFPFDMLIIDELSSFKNPESKRFNALKIVRPRIKKVIGLTGTPAPNSLLDLWSQVYLLDQGERLGATMTAYKEAFFTPKHNYSGPFGGYEIRKDIDKHDGPSRAEQEIYDRISDICVSLKAKDYLEIPKRLDQTTLIELPSEVKKAYDKFEEDQVMKLITERPGETITAVNAGALNVKLQQFANGAIYRENGEVYEVHREKLITLEEMVEAQNGRPAIIFYWFKHDLARIIQTLKPYEPSIYRDDRDRERWNKKMIPVLCLHPASAGHGLNLQKGGNTMIWFCEPAWSAEYKLQGMARVHRQGQEEITVNKSLVCKGTIDVEMANVITGKIAGQNMLMDGTSYAKGLIKKYAEKNGINLLTV